MLFTDVAGLPTGDNPGPSPTPEQVGEFYSHFGASIAAWQFVESQLFFTFSRAVSTENIAPLVAAFHVPAGFRVRLDMTNAAVKNAGLPAEKIAEWEKLYERAIKRAKKRNELAHSVICYKPSESNLKLQFFLSKSVASYRKVPPNGEQADRITLSQLVDITRSFQQLRLDMALFSMSFGPEMQPVSAT